MSVIEFRRADAEPLSTPLKRQLLVLGSLLNREMADMFKPGENFTAIAHVIEPLFHIAIVVLWHWLMRVIPVYGHNKILFISSGLYPLFVFIHTSTGFTGVSVTDGPHRRFPRYNMFDVILAKAVFKILSYSVVGVILFVGMYLFITPEALPFQPLTVVIAMASLAVMGVGVGMCNAAITPIWESWPQVYGPLSRTMMLFGGVLYVPDFLPAFMRPYVAMNPVLHGVELFRMGFYPLFPNILYSPALLYGSTAGSVVLGVILLRVLRVRIEE